MVKRIALALALMIAATPAAIAQVNPVYRQDPVTGNATQQQQIAVPNGFNIELQSGASIICDAGSTCPTAAGTVTGPGSAVNNNLASFNGTSGTIIKDSGKAPPTGTIVGTTDTQTLTGKTMAFGSNTMTGFGTTVAGQSCNPSASCGLSAFTNSLGSNVVVSNASFTTGPTVSQGAGSTTWIASGNVTLSDSTSGATVSCKLWDGGSAIADSTQVVLAAANTPVDAHLSGLIVSPTGSINIACQSTTTTTSMLNNRSSQGKDSTVTAVRIN